MTKTRYMGLRLDDTVSYAVGDMNLAAWGDWAVRGRQRSPEFGATVVANLDQFQAAFPVTHIVYEDNVRPQFVKRTPRVEQLLALIGAWCTRNGVTLRPISSAVVKKAFARNGHASQAEMVRAAEKLDFDVAHAGQAMALGILFTMLFDGPRHA